MIINFLNSLSMEIPLPFGQFHLICLAISIALVVLFFIKMGKLNERMVYAIYGFGSFILELTKQLMWSLSYTDGVYSFDYQWYSAPFQFCSTPMYVAMVLAFLKDCKLKNALIDYLSYFSIISAIAVMLYPNLVFCDSIIVNIHTMFLHCGSFAISMFVIANRKEEPRAKDVFSGLWVFIVMVICALIMDICVYNFVDLGEETFNMFYISPYFISVLPVFDAIQQAVPYPIFLLSYITAFCFGAFLVYTIVRFIANLYKKSF